MSELRFIPPALTRYEWNALMNYVALGKNASPCSYTIFTDATYCYARNGSTGVIDFTGPLANSSAIINQAIQTAPLLTSIYVKDDVSITGSIVINRKVNFHANTITLPVGMLGNGINVTNLLSDGKCEIDVNLIKILDPAWNADGIFFENNINTHIKLGYNAYYGNSSGATQGNGLHIFSSNGDGIYDCTFSGVIGYFNNNLYMETTGSGFINQNWFNECEFVGAGTNNIKMYNNGNGIGANHFNHTYTEPPKANGSNIHITSGPGAIYPRVEYNEFLAYDAYDVPTGTVTDYYADSNVYGTRFIGGFVVLGQSNDSGLLTSYTGVFDISSNQILNTNTTFTKFVPVNAGWTSSTGGTGVISIFPSLVDLTSGVTSGGTASYTTYMYQMVPTGLAYINWTFTNTIYELSFDFNRHNDISDVSEVARVQVKSVITVGDLSDRGIGIQVINNNLYAETFETSRTLALLQTVTNGIMYNIRIRVEPTVIHFYVNNILKLSITNAIYKTTYIANPKMVISVTNGSVNQLASIDVSNIQVLI